MPCHLQLCQVHGGPSRTRQLEQGVQSWVPVWQPRNCDSLNQGAGSISSASRIRWKDLACERGCGIVSYSCRRRWLVNHDPYNARSVLTIPEEQNLPLKNVTQLVRVHDPIKDDHFTPRSRQLAGYLCHVREEKCTNRRYIRYLQVVQCCSLILVSLSKPVLLTPTRLEQSVHCAIKNSTFNLGLWCFSH